MGYHGFRWASMEFRSKTLGSKVLMPLNPWPGQLWPGQRRTIYRLRRHWRARRQVLTSFLLCSLRIRPAPMLPCEKKSARRPVSRVLSPPCGGGWPFLWDARYRTPRATDPDGSAETRPARERPAIPTWSCSRWGLPCRRRRRRRGALLPHHFTLAARPPWGGAGLAVCFCGTFPEVALAGRYPAPCFRGARTFLPPPERRAAIRPSGCPT